MATKTKTFDCWRNYFKDANSGIFDIIEHAIKVAASDCPQEFRLRRGDIAEILFSCKLSRCMGCDRIELVVPCSHNEEDERYRGEFGGNHNGPKSEAANSNEGRNVNNSRDEQELEWEVNQTSNYSYGEAETLTDEIEEEFQTVREVLRIKDILDNCEDKSESVLVDLLKRLGLMALTVETLKVTQIGMAVKTLRKNGSKQISQLAQNLIEDWMFTIDEWMKATEAMAAAAERPESGKTSVTNDEEKGLPSPPLDEAAFFPMQPNSIELTVLFDGLDNDGNPKDSGEFSKKLNNCRKPSLQKDDMPITNRRFPAEKDIDSTEKAAEIMKGQGAVAKEQRMLTKPSKLSSAASGLGKREKPNCQIGVSEDTKLQQEVEKATIQRRPLPTQQK